MLKTGAMQLRLKNQIPSLATPRSIFKILKPEVSSNVSAANFAGNVCKNKVYIDITYQSREADGRYMVFEMLLMCLADRKTIERERK